MQFKTADLCDAFDSEVRMAEPVFRDFGGVKTFGGRIVTLRAPDDNSLVRKILEEAGGGGVLVVDGAGSTRCALLGDQLAQLACDQGWSGVVIHGCVRDSRELRSIPVGVKALHAVPRKSLKRGRGEPGVQLDFAGVTFAPGDYLYADVDGILVASRDLLAGKAS